MDMKVNIYRNLNEDIIHLLCTGCVDEVPLDVEYIDKAGDWDMCEVCDFQNVPDWYHGEE